MPSVINDTITLNIMRKGSKLINFELNVDENLPSRLFGDELRLKQIFNNLLSNAFKYTKEGEVEWRISFEKDGDDIWLVSSVRDTGIGIRQNDIQKLFSDYNQVDVKSNRSVEGTGLGLSITQKLVEMMDGEITVTSEYGQGSVFTARVRQKVLDVTPIGSGVTENLKNFCYADHKRDRSSQIVRAYIPYANVLVVDDVATNLDVAKGMLRPYGMTVDCVAGGLEAIELIRSGTVQYNAVFMDHMMPGMDGIEALRVIRDEIGTEYAKTVPIIALTANALVGNERMFIEKGFQDFLSKPIDILRLNVVVNRWVRDKEKERIFAVNQNAAADHAERRRGEGRRKIQNRRSGIDRRKIFENAIDGFNFKSGLDRFGGSDEIYHDVLNSYIKNTPPLLDRISKPRPETLLDYAITVHGIKSSSFSIGAEPAGTKAEALEHAAKAGDFTYVVTNHAAFIETVKKLIADLTAMLKKTNPEEAKPLKPEPDKETLNALSQACAEYDIDGVDNAMEELERYEYESQPELIAWLKEQIGLMGFKQIHERLSGR
jgi:CheY-like chemotaxis protein/anti-sigma regulatory factor (Ser/Thr protein kinase)